MLAKLLAHPLTRNLSVDDPSTTELRRRVIREKKFLKNIYLEWYGWLLQDLGTYTKNEGKSLELGSGGGFLSEIVPDCILSEVFPCSGVSIVASACNLPFQDASLRAILMVDVLHHIPSVEHFFSEASRALRPGGIIAMVEPWNTPWARFLYSRLHPEPFEPEATAWTIPHSGPLSGANGALPWIVFMRDRLRFQQLFPDLQIENLQLDLPFAYLASGGVSMRPLFPGWAYPAWRTVEKVFSPFMSKLAMFAHIVVRRIEK